MTLELPDGGDFWYDYMDEQGLFVGKNAIWHYPEIDLKVLNRELYQKRFGKK